MRFVHVLLLLLCVGVFAGESARRQPNIVFIVSDDHRFDGIGAAGNREIKTPNLDRLADDGILFSRTTVACPQCAPSRASILTGLFPHQHGYYSNKKWSREAERGFGRPTAVQQLCDAGYQTCLIGKWHLEVEPWKVGFSEVRVWMPQGGDEYTNAKLASGRSTKTKEKPGHVTEIFTDDAVAYLSSRDRNNPLLVSPLARGRNPEEAAAPFFLWLAYTAPHTPQKPVPERALAPYRDLPAAARPPGFPPDEKLTGPWAQYYSAITHLDEQIGRVLKALEDAGVKNDTVVFFIGDNGWMMGSHGHHGKMLAWEESARVPFIVRAPAGLGGWCGKSDALASSLDLPATWLALAGLPIPEDWPGQSLLPLLRDEKPKAPLRDEVASEFEDDKNWPGYAFRSIRTADWKYVLRPPHSAKELKSLLKEFKDSPRKPPELAHEELYDLRSDPHELKDLSASAAGEAPLRDLRRRMRAHLERTCDPALKWAE